jgi:hypothetical protein
VAGGSSGAGSVCWAGFADVGAAKGGAKGGAGEAVSADGVGADWAGAANTIVTAGSGSGSFGWSRCASVSQPTRQRPCNNAAAPHASARREVRGPPSRSGQRTASEGLSNGIVTAACEFIMLCYNIPD